MKTYTGPLVGAAVHTVLSRLSREGFAHSGAIYTGAHVKPTPDGGLFIELELVLVCSTEG